MGSASAASSRSRGNLLLPAVIGALTYATLGQGGFYWPQGSAFALVLVAAAAAAPSLRGLRPGLAAIAVLGSGLVASAAANGWPIEGRAPLATLATATAALMLGRTLVARGERLALVGSIAVLGAGVAVLGLAGLALHHHPLAMRAQGIWRTSSTLTYANSAGAFLALALFAGIALAYERPGRASRVLLAVILAGLATTLSRGGLLGAITGITLLCAVGGRTMLRGTARAVTSAAIASTSLVPSIASDHGKPLIALAGMGLALAVVLAPPMRLAPAARRALVGAAFLALSVGVVIATQHGGRLISSRISPGSEDRLRTWGNVVTASFERPVFGTGPGTFKIVEVDGDEAILTRYAHNEYLQALAETGLVGLASIVAGGAILLRWLWRTRPPRGTSQRPMWAVAAAACTAFAVHSAFDFVWRMPVLVAIAFLWLAIGTTSSRPGEGDRPQDAEVTP